MNEQARHFRAAVDRLQRALVFTAWCVPDDGQKRTKSFGAKLPIEGPRCPANVNETGPGPRTGKLMAAPGIPLGLLKATTLREAIDETAPRCSHKDHLMILETDAARRCARLHVYAIRQDGTPKYRGPLRTERFHELYAVHLFDLDVSEFAPFRDCPVGRDRGLVEINHG